MPVRRHLVSRQRGDLDVLLGDVFVGLGWVGAAAFCMFLQKWSKG